MDANLILWSLQGAVAVVFLATGLMKLFMPKDRLAITFKWTASFRDVTLKGIGLIETLGAIGIVLPEALRIFPWLSPIAALGLAVTMIGASLTNLRFKEYGALGLSLPLLCACAYIAWARDVLSPAF